jgi:hypothetical protein
MKNKEVERLFRNYIQRNAEYHKTKTKKNYIFSDLMEGLVYLALMDRLTLMEKER